MSRDAWGPEADLRALVDSLHEGTLATLVDYLRSIARRPNGPDAILAALRAAKRTVEGLDDGLTSRRMALVLSVAEAAQFGGNEGERGHYAARALVERYEDMAGADPRALGRAAMLWPGGRGVWPALVKAASSAGLAPVASESFRRQWQAYIAKRRALNDTAQLPLLEARPATRGLSNHGYRKRKGDSSCPSTSGGEQG